MSWRSLGRLFSGIKGAYNDINPSTLTGAIDVLVVEQPDGSFLSGPFHVRFGKLTAISPADKTVEVYVNGKYVNFIRMQLGSAGDAYFVEPDESDVSGEDFLRSTEEELFRTHWPSIASRRRRRRLRRDTAQSESDMNQPEYEELFDEGPQSDCEQSTLSSPDHDPRVAHFISDSMLHETFASRDDLEWAWGNFPQRKSEVYMGAKSVVVDTDEPPPLTRKSCTTLQSPSFAAVPKSEGVYLEDLVTPEVDQTVKEAYIYPPARTLSRSPRSRVHQDSGGCCVDAGYRSDGEHSPRSISPIYPSVFGLRLSLCGWPSLGSQLSEEKFFEHLVSYEEFIQDPEAILSNPNLTIQLNGKFVNWQVAAPSILSILAFQSELPHCVVRRLENLHMRKKEIRRTSWFSWGSRAAETADHAHSENTASAVQPLPQVAEIESPEQSELKKTPSVTVPDIETTAADSCKPSGRRSNRLSSEEIARLQLKPGRNEVEFRVTTKIQGTCICSASIFVWHWSDRIVVSDVDGTITRSDLLGHLLPMLGRDWTHFGVAGLYNLISRNGYRFIYVSTRALGQADITRSYLRHVNQNDLSLPEGPILLSPNSLLHAFHQEVIEKKPENFKIQCLLDVCSLFPSDHPPFYAGFGNKTNDAFAYEKAGIDRCHIFIVNPRGEVRNEFQPAKITSYTELSQMVDHYFPSIVKPSKQAIPISTTDTVQANTTSETQNLKADSAKSFDDPNIDMSKYSCFTYWRTTEFEPCSTYESSAEPSFCRTLMASNSLPFEDMFDQAVKHVPQLANDLDTETLLYFYARYKQATVGPCNTPKPGFFDFNGRKKWQAWSDLADMSEDQARREYVSKLFEVDPSWDPKDQSNKCAIYVSRMVCLDPEKVDGDCPDERDKPVFQAVKEGRVDLLQTILRDSPNIVNVTDSAMMTPLHWASDRGYTEIISTLLAHSADVNARDKDNQTPLHYACACGHLSGAKQLLQAGADPNAKDADGMSPLELAEDQFRSELMST